MFAACLRLLHFPCPVKVISCRHMVSGRSQRHGLSLHIQRDGLLDRPKPWLIIGLDNPGHKYEGTRHNVHTISSSFSACLRLLHFPCQVKVISCRHMVSGRSQRHELSLHIQRDGLPDRPKPWLIIGLGNPGHKYEGTRHNVGFEMVDYIAQVGGISISSCHCKALCGKGHIGNVPVLLAKPQTYMDLSGDSVGPLAAYYRIPLHNVLLMFDDMELPCGVLRLCPNGGHGGHIGVKSVIRAFRQNHDFARLRIGIGKPPRKIDPKAYVLEVFNLGAREKVNCALKEGAEAVRLLTSDGFFESANHFNLKQKYKDQKVDYLDFGKKHDS